MAAVPTGMQTCAKMLQMHVSRGGVTPWMQPKSYGNNKLASYHIVKFLAANFGFKYFHYSGHWPTGLQTCARMLQMHVLGGGGTPWMQRKSNGKI